MKTHWMKLWNGYPEKVTILEPQKPTNPIYILHEQSRPTKIWCNEEEAWIPVE